MRYNSRIKTSDKHTLPADIESLQKMVLELQSKNNELHFENQGLQQKLRHLMEQWQLSLQKRFGASSEGLPGQGELFNELEDTLGPAVDDVAKDQATATPPKKPRRPRIDASLPREEVLHDISDEETG